MLYVIATDADGAVDRVIPCPDGIDQALVLIANSLTREQEDVYANHDAIVAMWEGAVREAKANDDPPYSYFVGSRTLFGTRYGLAVIE